VDELHRGDIGVLRDEMPVGPYSASGGHVFPVAARSPELAAAISHAPLTDGPAATRGALRTAPPLTLLRAVDIQLSFLRRHLLGGAA
jgi:hypothetical protein